MRQKTLLIVENDRHAARHYRSMLAGAYEVHVALSGRQAIRYARRHGEIHLAVMEYRLPDMSGLDVLKEIKACRPSLPVIIVTAHGDEDTAVKAFRRGAKDYFKKPVAVNRLLNIIEFYLSLRNADRNIRRPIGLDDHQYPARPPLRDIAADHPLGIRKALQFIDGNFMTKIDLGSTADKACLSRFHFSRVFKRTTGVTYQEFITVCRVEKAKEMLKDRNRTVTDIAYAVGYDDPNNLIRNFKKHTGLTPTEYRNNR